MTMFKKHFNTYVTYGPKKTLHTYDSILERKKEKEFWRKRGYAVSRNFKKGKEYCFYSYESIY